MNKAKGFILLADRFHLVTTQDNGHGSAIVEEEDRDFPVGDLAHASPAVVFYGRVWYNTNANSKIDDGR